MSTKKRGRPKKEDLSEPIAGNGTNMEPADDNANADWGKVVSPKPTSYNPDKVRSKQVEIAKVRVKVNEAKEDLEVAVAASDFVKAQEIKVHIDQMAEEQVELENQLKVIRDGGDIEKTPVNPVKVDSPERETFQPESTDNSNSNLTANDSIVAKFSAVFEGQDEPQDESFSHDDTTDDEFAPPGAKKKRAAAKKKRGRPVVKRVKRLKKAKPQAPSFLSESIVGKYCVLIHREDPDYEESKESTPDQSEDLTKIDDCDENPNFALVVDFLNRFGEIVGLRSISIKDLQLMLCAKGLPQIELVQLHMVMLRKIKLPKIIITKKSWEKALIIFCKEAGGLRQESLDLSSQGYTELGLSSRLVLLKRLMEAQFDWNDHVRTEVEELAVEVLRQEPVGRDVDGHIYWTQIDETADIRVYTEDCRYYTWGSIAQSRQELVSLVERLKEDKLYKKEMERLKTAKEKQDAQSEIVDAIEIMAKEIEKDISIEKESVCYSCEVCSQNFGSRGDLMGHHSFGHMNMHLKTKFPHLVDKTQCKLCKFDAGEENLIWVHIGTVHDKVNSVLKENGLKPIEEVSVQDMQCSPQSEPADNQGTIKNITDSEDDVLRKIEMKINQLKQQMGDESVDENSTVDHANNSSEQVPNKCADDDVKTPKKRGRSSTKEKSGRGKSKGSSSSRSSSAGKDKSNSRSSSMNRTKEETSELNGSEAQEEITEPTILNDKKEEEPQSGKRPSRACKELTEAVKAVHAEFSFKKPKNSKSKSSSKTPSKPSTTESSDQEDSLANITDFLNSTQPEKEEVKKEDDDDSGFDSKDIKDETDEDDKSCLPSPSKRSRKCKNKSYNDDDPYGDNMDESKDDDKDDTEADPTVDFGKVDLKKPTEEQLKPNKMGLRKPKEGEVKTEKAALTKPQEEPKIIDVSKAHVKERKEAKLSCKKCNEWKDDTDQVFPCFSCKQGWHQMCVMPPLDQQPTKSWLCPLCQHIALVEGLEKTLVALDLKMEQAEENRLAALTENQNLTNLIDSSEEEDEEEDNQRTTTPKKAPKVTVQNESPEMMDVKQSYQEFDSDEDDDVLGTMGRKGRKATKVGKYAVMLRPNYNELSTDDEEGDIPVSGERVMCNCEGQGTCLFCKRMKGCTCDGAGTCRLCMSQLVIDEERDEGGTKSPSPELEVIEAPQMSTTELFLLTGQTKQPAAPPPPERGRGRGRVRGRVRSMPPGRGGYSVAVVDEDSSSDQVTLLDSQTLRPSGMTRALRSRGRMLTSRGAPTPRMVSQQYPAVRQGHSMNSESHPDTFESGVVVRGAMRPQGMMRPMGQPRQPMRPQMRPGQHIRPQIRPGQPRPMGQQVRQMGPPMRARAQPMRPMGMRPAGQQPMRPRGQPQMGQQLRPVRQRPPVAQNQGYVVQNQGYVQQNQGYAQQTQGYAQQTQGYVKQNQGYVQQNQGYAQPSQGYPQQRPMRPRGQPRTRRPGLQHPQGRAVPQGQRMMMQPRLGSPGARGRPRLQPPLQRTGMQGAILPRPRMQMRGPYPVRGQPRMRGAGRASRGMVSPPAAPQGPQILSVHSNRLAGIITSQYPNDGTVIVDLDDDDDDDDILVPTFNSNYKQPAPDFDIIDEDEMQNFNTSGEYIEDAYEQPEQPKYFPQMNQQNHY